MTRKLLIVFATLALVVPSASASGSRAPFRTDDQAAAFLETGLVTWAGVDLRAADFKTAFCLNGYYSRHENRTGKHFPQGKRNAAGEDVYRSFSCSLTTDGHSFNLYVWTMPGVNHWRVVADT